MWESETKGVSHWWRQGQKYQRLIDLYHDRDEEGGRGGGGCIE